VIAYSADTLKQTSVLNLTPNGSGGAIWMSGAGMASDGTSIYFLDANGSFDATVNAAGVQTSGDYGNAFLKLGTTSGLSVADYFEASNTIAESQADEDLGSGGALVLPDLTDAGGTVHHLALGAGKDSIIYVVNRDSMGKYNPVADAIYQELVGQIAGPFSVCRLTSTTRCTSARSVTTSRRLRSVERVFRRRRSARRQPVSARPARRRASLPTARRTALYGGGKRHDRGAARVRRDQSRETSCTTAIRQVRATSLVQATSSSRR